MRRKVLIISIISVILFIQTLGAQTWEKTKRLTWNSGSSVSPDLAVDSTDSIHLVWEDHTPENGEIYYKKSTNGGTSWTTKRLTWTDGFSDFPAIAVSSSNVVHVVWHDDISGNFEIYYKRSTNGGVTWDAARRISWTSGSLYPSIAVSSGNDVHILWSNANPGNDEIYHKRSTNDGITWTTKRLTWTPGDSFTSHLDFDSSDNIHLVWNDDTPGNYEIYYKRSTDGGTSWTTKRLTWISGGSYASKIAIDSSDYIQMIWVQQIPTYPEIYFKRSTNGGVTWTTKRLTWTSGGSYGSTIAVDSSDNIHMGFFDATSGNTEVYYKRSTDGGTTWTTKQLTWNSGESNSPSIAVDSSDRIHIVWEDDSSGGFEIYYRKGIQ